jgi:hypothetical protein
MNTKKIILILLVVMILALTIASTASAKKGTDPCDTAWAKFFKIADALSNSKATNPKAQTAQFNVLMRFYGEVLAACP